MRSSVDGTSYPRSRRRPGSGRSPGDDYTLRAQAAAVEELMRELDEPTLLGHSFGGFVAMQHLVDFPGSAARLVASCTDAEEDEPEDAPEDPFEGMPEDVVAGVEAAFEREQSVATPEECRQVWRDQMPFFAVDPVKVTPMLDDVVFRVEAHGEHARPSATGRRWSTGSDEPEGLRSRIG
jgi:pimeloyl-ACP methyl ester carboxylesterase